MPPLPPPASMFADSADIERNAEPGVNEARGRSVGLADATDAVPCSVQRNNWRLAPEYQAVGITADTQVYFADDPHVQQEDVIFPLAGGVRTGEALRVERVRYQEAGGVLGIWVADCRSR